MVKRAAGILWLAVNSMGMAQARQAPFKVFLVGDAGEVSDNRANMGSLQRELSLSPNSVVLFLGDNSYKNALGGLLPYGYRGFDSGSLTQSNILSQLNTLAGYRGSAYFIPGNHDWWNLESYQEGKSKLKMEQHFIEENLKVNKTLANPANTFQPRDGSAGPDYVVLNHDKLRIIFIDTYRLIMGDFTRDPADFPQREARFYESLDQQIGEGYRLHQQVIVAGHHPVYNKGLDSASFRSPYLFSRIKASSINFPSYKKMALHLRNIFHKYPGLYYVCGHVHGLQYNYSSDSIHYIISGAGSKTLTVTPSEMARRRMDPQYDYAQWNSRGFFEVDFIPGAKERIFLYFEEGKKKIELAQQR